MVASIPKSQYVVCCKNLSKMLKNPAKTIDKKHIKKSKKVLKKHEKTFDKSFIILYNQSCSLRRAGNFISKIVRFFLAI